MSNYRHTTAERIKTETNDIARSTAELFVDPINRYYRYPLADLLVRFLKNTFVTSNQVTFFHTLLGISSGFFIAQGTYTSLIVAAIVYEVRNVLDCVDGVLARAKNTMSPIGKTIDELGDGISFLSMLTGCYFFLQTQTIEYSAWSATLAVFLGSFWLAGSAVIVKSRFFSPLMHGDNKVEAEYRESYFNLRKNKVFFASRFLHVANILQMIFIAPGLYWRSKKNLQNNEIDNTESEFLISQADKFSLKSLVVFLSFLNGEFLITMLQVGMLTNNLWLSMKWVFVFCVGGYFLLAITTNFYMFWGYSTMRESSVNSLS